MAPAEGGKKNDATVPIVIVIGAILLLLLFGGQGCNSISLPSYGPGTGSGGSNPSPHYNGYQCDSRRYDCRGHYDGNGRWVADGGARGERQDSGHEHRKPRPTDDPDPPGER